MSIVPSNPPYHKDDDIFPTIPFIPRGTSKVLFEFSKLLIHDDRQDIWKFSYMGHPSRTHHWLIGGAGILASTLTGLLEKVNEMFEETVQESDPNNQAEQQMIQIGRFLQHKATQGVQELNYIAQHPPQDRVVMIERQTVMPIRPPMSPQQPIYMGKVQQPITVKKKALPPPVPQQLPPPSKPKIPTMPTFLANKGKPKEA